MGSIPSKINTSATAVAESLKHPTTSNESFQTTSFDSHKFPITTTPGNGLIDRFLERFRFECKVNNTWISYPPEDEEKIRKHYFESPSTSLKLVLKINESHKTLTEIEFKTMTQTNCETLKESSSNSLSF